MIIPDCTITDHTITDWSYYFFSTNTASSITNINYDVLFVSRTVLLPIRYITNKSYYRIDYHRFVLLLNIPITV